MGCPASPGRRRGVVGDPLWSLLAVFTNDHLTQDTLEVRRVETTQGREVSAILGITCRFLGSSSGRGLS